MKRIGGGGRIRTHGPREGTTVFKTAAFDHSATPPYLCLTIYSNFFVFNLNKISAYHHGS